MTRPQQGAAITSSVRMPCSWAHVMLAGSFLHRLSLGISNAVSPPAQAAGSAIESMHEQCCTKGIKGGWVWGILGISFLYKVFFGHLEIW